MNPSEPHPGKTPGKAPEKPSVSAHGNISADASSSSEPAGPVRCVVCDYNLHAQPRESGCPECGTPVARSIERGLVDLKHPITRHRVMRAFQWMLIALAVYGLNLTPTLGSWLLPAALGPLAGFLVQSSLFPAAMILWWLAMNRLLDAISVSAPPAISTRKRWLRRLLVVELAVSLFVAASAIVATWWQVQQASAGLLPLPTLQIALSLGWVLADVLSLCAIYQMTRIGVQVYRTMNWRVLAVGSLVLPAAALTALSLGWTVLAGVWIAILLCGWMSVDAVLTPAYAILRPIHITVLAWLAAIALVGWLRLRRPLPLEPSPTSDQSAGQAT